MHILRHKSATYFKENKNNYHQKNFLAQNAPQTIWQPGGACSPVLRDM